mgnify:CR=1 FL=1
MNFSQKIKLYPIVCLLTISVGHFSCKSVSRTLYMHGGEEHQDTHNGHGDQSTYDDDSHSSVAEEDSLDTTQDSILDQLLDRIVVPSFKERLEMCRGAGANTLQVVEEIVHEGHPVVLEVLAELDPNFNIQNDDGFTAAHVAAK